MKLATIISSAVLAAALATLPGYAATDADDTAKLATEAQQLQRVSIAADYQKLKKDIAKDGAMRLLLQLPRAGADENNKGDFKTSFKALQRFAKSQGIKVKREIGNLGLVAVYANDAQLDAILDSGLATRVAEDRLIAPSLTQSVPWINADIPWAYGFSGTDQAVAIIDTGYDLSHPLLAGNVVEEACFSTTDSAGLTMCPNGQNQMFGMGAAADCYDTYGSTCSHGTHVAGIAAGNNGSLFGVAPDAKLVLVNVFHYNYSYGSARAWESDMIAGLDWVLNTATTPNIAAANMSIGGGVSTTPCDYSAIASVINTLRQAGIATVIAAGNDSSSTGVSWPGCVSEAITVTSSLKDSDQYSFFSNVSPQVDIVAPGSSIYSSVPRASYTYFSGTSMAAPHIAGVFATLRGAFPNASVSQIEAALEATGVPMTHPGANVTLPRVDVLEAYLALGGLVGDSQSYQAEEARWHNAVVESEHAGFSGTGYVNTANMVGPWVEFDLVVNSAGTYRATVVYANASSSARATSVLINGAAVTALTYPATTTWASWAETSVDVTLHAGTNTLRLAATTSAGAPNIDRLGIAALSGANSPPVLLNPIGDKTYYETLASTSFWLGEVFADAEGDPLAFSASSSNGAVAGVSVSGGSSNPHLAITPGATGSSTITVTANDGNGTAESQFLVTVLPNQSPSVVAPLPDYTLALGDEAFTVDLASVFVDPDGDTLTFNYEKSNDDNDSVTMTSPSTLLLNPQMEGSLTVHVQANDGKYGHASDTFVLLVTAAANQTPTVVNPIGDYELTAGNAAIQLDLANVFSDADGDILSFSHMPSNLAANTVSLNGSMLSIGTATLGTVTHTVTANDGAGGSTSDNFVVTVSETNSGFSVTIQAEDAAWSAGAVETEHAGYNLLGYVNTPNTTGQWLSFEVNVPAGGVYNVAVRFANGSSGNRAAAVLVNGSTVLTSLAFNPTNTWSNWATTHADLYLQAGLNTVRFNLAGSSGAANIDEYQVSSSNPGT